MSKRPDLSAAFNRPIAQIKPLANLQVDVNKHKPVHEVHEWVIFEHLNAIAQLSILILTKCGLL